MKEIPKVLEENENKHMNFRESLCIFDQDLQEIIGKLQKYN